MKTPDVEEMKKRACSLCYGPNPERAYFNGDTGEVLALTHESCERIFDDAFRSTFGCKGCPDCE